MTLGHWLLVVAAAFLAYDLLRPRRKEGMVVVYLQRPQNGGVEAPRAAVEEAIARAGVGTSRPLSGDGPGTLTAWNVHTVDPEGAQAVLSQALAEFPVIVTAIGPGPDAGPGAMARRAIRYVFSKRYRDSIRAGALGDRGERR